mmetsp:Transcript_12312/g.37066  ORF Transcript_12312/g.37066 Transcript_12312/m.37066 type:complete len:162 (+) Transcript_12312:144-629(+)
MLRALTNSCRSRLSSIAAVQQQALPAFAGCVIPYRGLKETTGLVGVPVDPNARENLLKASQRVLDAVATRIPTEAYYRFTVEEVFNYWVDLLKSPLKDEEIEEKLSAQLEELIKMANDEMICVDLMEEHRPWELPEGQPKPRIVTWDEAEEIHKNQKPPGQ